MMKNLEPTVILSRSLEKVITEEKTLLYNSPSVISYLEAKPYKHLLEILKTDDTYTGFGTLALHKDSEFLSSFNQYIMKALESGIYKRLYRKYHSDLYTNERFGLLEPESLGASNVMSAFILLGFFLFLSIVIALLEFMNKKYFGHRTSSSAWPASK